MQAIRLLSWTAAQNCPRNLILLIQSANFKRLFLCKVIDEKKLGPLISSYYVLTVICQQCRKYRVT